MLAQDQADWQIIIPTTTEPVKRCFCFVFLKKKIKESPRTSVVPLFYIPVSLKLAIITTGRLHECVNMVYITTMTAWWSQIPTAKSRKVAFIDINIDFYITD